MRILLHGMQSSGASLITYFLAQRAGSVGLVDVWIRHLTPALPSGHASSVIAKCTVSTLFDFDQHADRFRPERTVLVLRDPVQNYASLQRKPYASEGGGIDEKFEIMERVFQRRSRFDVVLAYEDFVARPHVALGQLHSAGIEAGADFYEFRRSTARIRRFNFRHDEWCRAKFGISWGFGNVQGTRLNPAKLHRSVPEELREHVRGLCPGLTEHYENGYAWVSELTHRSAERERQPTGNGGRSTQMARLLLNAVRR
jgi:hypothetical protein